MKFVPISLAAAAICITNPALAQGTRTYNDLPEFNKIDVSAGVTLIAEVGGPQTVTVSTDDGDFSDFEIEVDDSELSVSREWNRLRWHNKKSNYKVVVTVPELVAIDASSGSHANVSKISANRFMVDVSSGGHASLAGNCQNCVVDISSGGQMEAQQLSCDSAAVDVSSGGHGTLTVLTSLVGDASSGGHVAVYGNPQQVSLDRSSGGRIKLVSTSTATRD